MPSGSVTRSAVSMPKLGEADPVDKRVVVVDAEVEILEEAEQRQVGDHRDRQDQLARLGARSIGSTNHPRRPARLQTLR